MYKTYQGDKVPIKAWVEGVPIESEAIEQLKNVASLPFIHKHVAAMPDVHFGMGATIGSVIPTDGAVIPAAVGVDIGCGMRAVKTGLVAPDLPDLRMVRMNIEAAIPVGFGASSTHNKGGWYELPKDVQSAWTHQMAPEFREIIAKHPGAEGKNNSIHLGTLGSGNHFIEVCRDVHTYEIWLMVHSGSRGCGNKMAQYFIKKAKEEMKRYHVDLPDPNLAFFPQGTSLFDDYMQAVQWAQRYAKLSRALMMKRVIMALAGLPGLSRKRVLGDQFEVDCHHNYVEWEHHYGKNILLTRKGAVSAKHDEWGIIPGSMGAKSYIVRGLGNRESFNSCSHGAGRRMSRRAAKETFTVADHIRDTADVECRKDETVLDETPGAYKDIDSVMAAQTDLVTPFHEIKQIVCVKG